MAYNFNQLDQKLDKAYEHLVQDISTLRTGRASVQLLDGVMVEAYGGMMKLIEVGSVSAPDPTLLVISPWDKSLLGAIGRAVMVANLGVQPVIDGDIIRIAIPPLTEEKRKEMVKRLHQKIESGKVMMRTIRGEVKKEIEEQKGSEGVSEDDLKQEIEILEKKTQQAVEKLDSLAEKKEKELMQI